MEKIVRVFWGLCIAFNIAVVLSVYILQYRLTDQNRHIAQLRARVAAEQQAVSVLQAEWSFLGQPHTIQALLDKRGGKALQPLQPRQIVSLEDVDSRSAYVMPVKETFVPGVRDVVRGRPAITGQFGDNGEEINSIHTAAIPEAFETFITGSTSQHNAPPTPEITTERSANAPFVETIKQLIEAAPLPGQP